MSYTFRAIVGAEQKELPDWQKVSIGYDFSEVGICNGQYAVGGVNANLLVDKAVIVALWNGVEQFDSRFILRSGADEASPENESFTVSGRSVLDVFRKVVVEEIAGAPGQSVKFDASNVGEILINLFQAAQARGAMTGITWSFTNLVDSNGTAWDKVLTIEYKLGLKYLDLIRNLVDQGMVEFRLDGNEVQAFIADQMGVDRSIPGVDFVELRSGLDYEEMPRKWSSEEQAKYSMTVGDNGIIVRKTDGAVPDGPYGREEMAVSQGGTSDVGTLTLINDAALKRVSSLREQLTRKVVLREDGPIPTVDYRVSDYILERINEEDGVSRASRYRIRSIVVDIDADGEIGSASIVLNDRFLEDQIRIARRVNGIIGGASADGGGNGVPVEDKPDTTTPNPPTGLLTKSETYLTDKGAQSLVTFDWNPPSLNTDGTALVDLQDYEMQWRYSLGQTRKNLVRNPTYRKTNSTQTVRRNYVLNPAMRAVGASSQVYKNLVPGGFSVDSNADGIADGWAAYQAGTTGALTRSLVAGNGGGMAQRVQAAGLGTTAGDRAGVSFQVPVGQATASVNSLIKFDLKAALGADQAFVIFIDYKQGATITGTQTFTVTPAQVNNAAWTTFTVPAWAIPANTDAASVYVWVWGTGGAVTAVDFTIDNLIIVNAVAPQAPNFFDGATAAAEGKTYAWVSTANASGSTMSALPLSTWAGSAGTRVQGPNYPGYAGFAGEFRGSNVHYMAPASVGVAGEYYAHRAVLAAIPGETPAGATVQVRVHDGTGYTTFPDAAVALPADGTPVEVVGIAAAATTNTGPRVYFYPSGGASAPAPFRVMEVIVEKVYGAGATCGEYFDGSTTYENIATGKTFSSLGNGTVVTQNYSFGGKRWTKIFHPQSGYGARLQVDLVKLVNGASYVVSALVHNASDDTVTFQPQWCDVGVSHDLQPRETRRVWVAASRATYDAVYRFVDFEIMTASWVGDLLVTDLNVHRGTTPSWFWSGTTSTRDGLTNSWSGTINSSESIQTGSTASYQALGQYSAATWSYGWRADPSGAYRILYKKSVGAGGIAAFDVGAQAPVVAGRWYAAKIKLRSPNAVNLIIRTAGYTAASALNSWLNDGVNIALPGGLDWTEVSLPAEFVASATSVTGRFLCYATDGLPDGSILEFKEAVFEEVPGFGYEASDYYDGSTPDGQNFSFAWDGAVDDSYSSKTLNTALDNTWRPQIVNDSDAAVDGLIPESIIEWRVRARDGASPPHLSSWATAFAVVSSDAYAPPAPSAPTLYSKLGTVTVTWDGLNANGTPMPPDFDRLEVHMSDTAGFTATSATYRDFLKGAGSIIVTGQPGGAVRYFKFLAIDTNGNISELSPEASITVNRISGPDIEANTVTTNELAVGAVHAEDIQLGVFGRNLIADPSFEEDYSITTDDATNRHHWRIHPILTGGTYSVYRPEVSPTSNGARSGNKSLGIMVANNVSKAGVVSNAIPVTSGDQLVFSWSAARYESATAAKLYTRIIGGSTEEMVEYSGTTTGTSIPFDGEDPNFAENQALNAGSDRRPIPEEFQDYYGQITVPAGVNFVGIAFYVYQPAAQSTIYIDDVAAIPLGTEAAELTAAGLRLFDERGNEVAAFVSNRSNYFSVSKDGNTVASISETGEMSAQDLTVVNDPQVQGSPLIGKLGNTLPDIVDFLNDPVVYARDYETDPIGIIEQYAKGVVAWGQWPGSAFTQSIASGQEMSLFELGFDCEPGRHYAFRMNPLLFNITGSGYIGMRLRYTSDGSTPSLSSSTLAFNYTYAQAPFATLDCVARLFNGGATKQTQLRVLFCVSASGPTAVSVYDTANIALPTIEDLGPVKQATGDIRNYKTGGTTGGGTTGGGTAVKKTYTKTYASTSSATYKGSGSKRTDTSDVVQGYNSYNGNGKGIWLFPSMTADLSGATVNKVEVYAYANHWYNNSGGTARIHVHGYSSAPGSSPSLTYATQSTGWPKPGGRWVTLPSSLYAGFKSGTYRGFGMGPAPSNSLTYYGRFNGGTGARIRVTYTK